MKPFWMEYKVRNNVLMAAEWIEYLYETINLLKNERLNNP